MDSFAILLLLATTLTGAQQYRADMRIGVLYPRTVEPFNWHGVQEAANDSIYFAKEMDWLNDTDIRWLYTFI